MLLTGFDSFAYASLKCRHYERPISQSLSPRTSRLYARVVYASGRTLHVRVSDVACETFDPRHVQDT